MATKLYRVSSPQTSPVWNDITPEEGVPHYPLGLAQDSARSDGIAALVAPLRDENTTLLQSVNTGASWAFGAGGLSYSGLRKSGDILLLFGNAMLDISLDNGVTVAALTGNWASVFGSMGRFSNIIAIL